MSKSGPSEDLEYDFFQCDDCDSTYIEHPIACDYCGSFTIEGMYFSKFFSQPE